MGDLHGKNLKSLQGLGDGTAGGPGDWVVSSCLTRERGSDGCSRTMMAIIREEQQMYQLGQLMYLCPPLDGAPVPGLK